MLTIGEDVDNRKSEGLTVREKRGGPVGVNIGKARRDVNKGRGRKGFIVA